MKTRVFTSCLYVSLILVCSLDARAFLAHGPIELSIGVIINTINGVAVRECIQKQIVERSGQARLMLGVADEHSTLMKDWVEIHPSVYCVNDFDKQINTELSDTSAAPLLLANVQVNWRENRQMEDERVLALDVSISLERRDVSKEENLGDPRYEVKRTFFFSEDGLAYIPVLLATGEELQALGIEDVFINLGATVLKKQQEAIYGTLLVISDTDGAEVLLDGGIAGKIPVHGELEISLVRAGMREVGLRDASGKIVRKAVRVEAGRTVLVQFDKSQKSGSSARYALEALGKNEHGYEEFLRKIDGGVVVRIPQGEFLMGNKNTERTPLEHQVYVSEFLMDKTGVSWGQYKQFAAATGISLPPHKPYWGILDDHPAIYVTWEEAKTYCEWAGGRLPTEAEREKAARGTDGRKFPWGDEEPNDRLGVFRQSWGYDSTGAVGGLVAGASPYGLLNMGGNVWEWCADWYDGDYYQISPFRDPQGPALGRAHVVRGGSWDSRPTVLSASCRSWGHRGYRDGDFGFRCAMNSPR
jgi:formylglycine-generating enzyme required for sulfatase activity